MALDKRNIFGYTVIVTLLTFRPTLFLLVPCGRLHRTFETTFEKRFEKSEFFIGGRKGFDGDFEPE